MAAHILVDNRNLKIERTYAVQLIFSLYNYGTSIVNKN